MNQSTDNQRAIELLLVEDNPGDVRLTQEAFKESKVCNSLHVVTDGVAALAYLRRSGEYANSPRPDLILLDLNLPKKDGREVLKEIKEDLSLRTIPVIILTSSGAEEDVLLSYNSYANCFITKPVMFEKLLQVVKKIDEFWVSIVRLPHL